MLDEIKIGNEDRKTGLEEWVEDQFDAGWKEFVKEIQRKSKLRTLRLITVIRSKYPDIATDVEKVLKTKGITSRVEIVRQTKGIMMKDNRWKSFPVIWVFQKQDSIYDRTPEGTLQVKLDEKRFLEFHYYL